ncbi:MAG: AAA family ATPase [Nanoarchaeota archaeon]|nr:AAA family ATPase [Nanoarchaeota archaeon]
MGELKRISTGIKGLDDKIEGGFFQGSVNLIAGKTGTGKTAFCASFLYDGAHKGETGFYVTTEQSEEDIKADVDAMFGWDLDDLEKKGKLKFLSIKPNVSAEQSKTDTSRFIKIYTYDLLEKIEKGIKAVRASRVVIDSVSIIEMFIRDEYLARAVLMGLMEKLKSMKVTAIFTGTIPETMESLSGGGIVEYLVDSVIKLDFVPVAEDYKRTLNVRKMRRTDHSVFIHPFAIEKTGLKVMDVTST